MLYNNTPLGEFMNRIKEKYNNYLYKYLGVEIFIYKTLKMDELTKSVLIILMDFYKNAKIEIDNSNDMESLNNAFYKYKKVMNETVESYITTYCDTNNISYEKIKYNEYLINNKKTININDGLTYIYKNLNKIDKKMKIAKGLINNIKGTIKF